MTDFIAKPFGVLMEFIYNNLAFHNYGYAIIVFTLIVKIILLPLNVKQQRSMERQQALMPELEALRNKYKDDNNKYQEEQMNLYNKYKINPMSGCLPMLIQFPLIIILYRIIRRPLTYISGLSAAVVKALAEAFTGTGAGEAFVKNWANHEIDINNFFMSNQSSFTEIAGSSAKLINMKFLGFFDLGVTPQWKFWTYGADWKIYVPLLLIPILAVATSYLSQAVTTYINNGGKKKKKEEKKEKSTADMMNNMVKFMPLMTLVIGFMVPAGLGLYWTVSNVLTMLQTVLIKLLFNRKKKEGSV